MRVLVDDAESAAVQARFDDILLIDTHAHGVWSAQCPVLRFESAESPVFEFYADAFERVWASASRRLDADNEIGCNLPDALPTGKP